MEEKFALYYPFIHMRDVNWLKSALLTFGQVRRMVPADFALSDESFVSKLRAHKTWNGEPLIDEEPLHTAVVNGAHLRLVERLQNDSGAIERFSREKAEIVASPYAFRIHRAKATDELLGFLSKHHLAWPADEASDWIAVHPRLGEAIMSVTAIAIARYKGLHIVTSDSRVHKALATNDEEAVFDALAAPGTQVEQPTKTSADEVLQAVLVHTFDLESLSPTDVAALVREQQGLSRLRQAEAGYRDGSRQDPANRGSNRTRTARTVSGRRGQGSVGFLEAQRRVGRREDCRRCHRLETAGDRLRCDCGHDTGIGDARCRSRGRFRHLLRCQVLARLQGGHRFSVPVPDSRRGKGSPERDGSQRGRDLDERLGSERVREHDPILTGKTIDRRRRSRAVA